MKKVIVLGGGFCGSVVAVNLTRLTEAPLDVTVINHRYPLGRGVAYSTRRSEHLLNVVARNMSALADQPDHFVDWLGTRSEYAEMPATALRESFVPRRVYGDYLQSLFFWYARSYADGKKVRLRWIEAEATEVEPAAERCHVWMADGQSLEADRVVLATGNLLPGHLPGGESGMPFYFRNPWSGWENNLPDVSKDVILVGTGLTMIDAFLTLMARGWQGKIFAISRNGLLPLSHFKGVDYPTFPEGDPAGLGLDELHRLIRTHCDRMKAAGINPAILVDRLRPFTQRIWQNFTLPERQRFLREFRTLWNVTRHRIPGAIHEQLTQAIAAGKLEILRGTVCRVASHGDGLCVTVVNGDGEERPYLAGAAINCTGPDERYAGAESELLSNLLKRNLVCTDDLGMGLRATPEFVVLDAQGERSKYLMALGPLLKGTLWETTAVPELRNQAFRIAEFIIAEMKHKRADVRTVPETYADVVEYSI